MLSFKLTSWSEQNNVYREKETREDDDCGESVVRKRTKKEDPPMKLLRGVLHDMEIVKEVDLSKRRQEILDTLEKEEIKRSQRSTVSEDK